MKRVSRTVSVLLLLCLVSIWALPVKKNSAKDKKNVPTKTKEQSQLHEQEKELENLAKLQKAKADNVLLQTTKDIKIIQEDGKKEKVVKTAKNMVNADNGDLLSSVRKTLKTENKGHETPKVSGITKIDIPSEGVHNILADNGRDEDDEDIDDDSEEGPYEADLSDAESLAKKKNMPSIVSEEDSSESDESILDEDIKDLQKSSKAMATYLLQTGNFERFEDALRDIVKVGLMTVSEANEYERIVLGEYERLLALEKAEELQAKAAQSRLNYAERDYDIPYQLNNDMSSEEDADDDVKRYMTRRRGRLPPPIRRFTGADYTDYAEPMQSYNAYDPNEMQSIETRDNNEWLNQLLEQANGADYPETRQSYTPVDQERMRTLVQGILDSEPMPKAYSSQFSSEEEEEQEEEEGNNEEDEMMKPLSSEEDHSQSDESVSALKALAKMDTPTAKRNVVRSETKKHQAKKQGLTGTDKKMKKKKKLA